MKTRHRHKGPKVKYKTRRNKIRYRRRPKHIISKHKNKTYSQLRKRYKIHPLADDDGDGVRNYKDCRPWDRRRQDLTDEEKEDSQEKLTILLEASDNYREVISGIKLLEHKLDFAKQELIEAYISYNKTVDWKWDSPVPEVQAVFDEVS